MAKPNNGRGLRFGEGSVYERGGKYQARWRDGNTWRAKTFATCDEAEDHLRQIARDRRDGRYESPSDLTVTQMVKEYRDRGKSRWSTNTQATYRLLAEKHVLPYIGKRKVIDLAPRILQLWIDDLRKTDLSPAVIENAKIVLSGACREAVQMGVIPTNPALGLRLPARKKSQMATWSVQEVRDIIRTCGEDLWMRTFYTVALTTGMRPGELRALMWRDIDFEQMRLQCRRSMTRDASFRAVIGDQTKSGRTRVIAIPDETVSALKLLRDHQEQREKRHDQWHATGVVFDRGDGRFMPLTTLETRHDTIQARAKVKRIRLHDLRHTFSTLALQQGANIKVISDILGHSSIAITMDTYVHTDVGMHRSVVNALGSLIVGQQVLPRLPDSDTVDGLHSDTESCS